MSFFCCISGSPDTPRTLIPQEQPRSDDRISQATQSLLPPAQTVELSPPTRAVAPQSSSQTNPNPPLRKRSVKRLPTAKPLHPRSSDPEFLSSKNLTRMQVPAKVIEEMNKLTLTEEGGVQGNPSQLKKYTKLCQAAFVMTQMIKRPPPGINKTNGHHGNYTIRTVR